MYPFTRSCRRRDVLDGERIQVRSRAAQAIWRGARGDQGYGIDPRVVDDIAEEIAEIVHDGVQLAVVVGGGNIFRGLAGSAEGMDRSQGRLHRHAGHGDECARSAGRLRAPRHLLPRAERHQYAGSVRALHSPPSDPPFGEGARRHFGGRHGQSLFHDRYDGGPCAPASWTSIAS